MAYEPNSPWELVLMKGEAGPLGIPAPSREP